MTDSHHSHPPTPARDSASTGAMDQALDWLIVLESPSEAQRREFQAWLAADPRLGVSREVLDAAVANPLELTGSAAAQVDALAARVAKLAAAHPEGAAYAPGDVL